MLPLESALLGAREHIGHGYVLYVLAGKLPFVRYSADEGEEESGGISKRASSKLFSIWFAQSPPKPFSI